MPRTTSVLICGAGSAGLCAGVWLSRLRIPFIILESRSGPLKQAQADGVQCRTVEIFDSFNLAEGLLREAYHVLEDAFWAVGEDDENGRIGRGIRRTKLVGDTPRGLSHMPHVILNQARVNGLLVQEMGRWDQSVEYGWEVKGVEVEEDKVGDSQAYCVKVVAEKDGKDEEFLAKYALGSDGAHSIIRKSLGFKMLGDSTDAVWGVMDVYPCTNFPDIRKKTTIHSSSGSLVIIPREGGSLARFYIELSGVDAKSVKLATLQTTAQRIFAPYTMEIAETAWWSAYPIGQRLADHFSSHDRVFLTGDACHTHSPKAGQGMNVSFADGYDIGWKLGAVLRGQAPTSLLNTYILERQKVAEDLIEFDRQWTKLLKTGEGTGDGLAEKFSDTFIKSQRYTAGLTAKYEQSSITSTASSEVQTLAKHITVGMRFPSAQVVRFCDAKAMQLVKALPADGRWRIIVFAGDIRKPQRLGRLEKLGTALAAQDDGLIWRYTTKNTDVDSVIEPILVLAGKHVEVQQEDIPDVFWPISGKWRMRDLHKVFVDEESYNSGHGHAYEHYGIDEGDGAVVIVRPDHCE
ncbi:MAG: hypothetical protein Q9160_005770 [Pyrenula sp. 1 TL-2023]